ncbi:hypothetical protein EDC56_2328 [Sinobacterium caligoides]|uniref:Uncharacterized protein n=1 Tax=Sinobacterium caligoides TaxID=933926 RepID=A0A3N2DQJ7_9GAMM|nr:hypothetical protein [Sinobacterium caligoides]ROS01879.1 hypothetical protein EDC56_2328 [Sinobacterium caligoides]
MGEALIERARGQRVKLFQPVTPEQLAKIEQNDCRAFSSDTAGKTYFYPKLHSNYAENIAKNSFSPRFGSSYVVEFEVDAEYINQFPIRSIGYDEHQEYCVDVSMLADLNSHIRGRIAVKSCFQDTVKSAIQMVS